MVLSYPISIVRGDVLCKADTYIGAVQMRLPQCPIRSILERYNIGSRYLPLLGNDTIWG